MHSTEVKALYLVVPANILYTLAAVTDAWFELPPHASYGLWWVNFCDYLSCQIILAFHSEEPGWYHVLQVLSLFGWASLLLSLLMLLSTRFDKCLPKKLMTNQRNTTVAAVCLFSGFSISSSLVMFYTKLDESSPKAHPQISWSAVLAGVSCICQLLTGMFLMQAPSLTVLKLTG
ncbi:uncharacterized protein LOC121371621 [Gigantopelta aegis]|uniref:uncharacterized protein LOC121371621 n=1 Tax=Gigantopelta aegis TaxID=1735272 RepID=UPI001B888F4F|nr:uncharacterized protein LOC121371621 [Gigantopelta aegis]